MLCRSRSSEKRGYFIAGKFDQYKRDIPYATPAQAFQGLVRQLLGESDTRIESGGTRCARRSARVASSWSISSPSSSS